MEKQILHVYFELGSLVLVQFRLQDLLGHLHFTLEAVWVLIGLIWLGRVLSGSLSVMSGCTRLPLSSKHNTVPELQPLEQTSVGKLPQNSQKEAESAKEFFSSLKANASRKLTSSLRSSV